MNAKPPTLELRDVSKSFGSVQALQGVDFEVRAGEVMALVGDNGAGKSTLVKCVAGTHAADGGEIFFEGDEVNIHGPKDAARLGIEVVYQDLALCDNLDVVQNMYLGREANHWQVLDEPTMEQHTASTLKSLAVTTIGSIRQPVATLSGGQRQSIAVAKAVQWNSRLVILDEPTAALGVAQTEQVGATLRFGIDLVAKAAQSRTQQQAAEASARGGHRRVAHRTEHRLGDALHQLERHIPREAVRDDHVGDARDDVPALDVAYEAKWCVDPPLELLAGLHDGLAATAPLLPV